MDQEVGYILSIRNSAQPLIYLHALLGKKFLAKPPKFDTELPGRYAAV
jgi:hypothetical protein